METNNEKQNISRQYKLGVVLIVIAGITAIIALMQMWRSWYADFPCASDAYGDYPSEFAEPGIRIAYCIDYIGRKVISGAGIYAEGSSEKDSLVIETSYRDGFENIVLERIGKKLKINYRTINPGHSFITMSWLPSLNPWLLYANYLVIRNAGVEASFGTLLVTGQVYESWLPNPVGFILLIMGIKLVSNSKKKKDGIL